MYMIVVDVREPDEYNRSHVKNALNLPLSTLYNSPEATKELPKNEKIVVYCNSGNRSSMAAEILKHQGFTDVENGINQDHVESALPN